MRLSKQSRAQPPNFLLQFQLFGLRSSGRTCPSRLRGGREFVAAQGLEPVGLPLNVVAGNSAAQASKCRFCRMSFSYWSESWSRRPLQFVFLLVSRRWPGGNDRQADCECGPASGSAQPAERIRIARPRVPRWPGGFPASPDACGRFPRGTALRRGLRLIGLLGTLLHLAPLPLDVACHADLIDGQPPALGQRATSSSSKLPLDGQLLIELVERPHADRRQGGIR